MLGIINFAEILTKLSEYNVPVDIARQAVDSLKLEVVVFTEDQACLVAELRPLTRTAGLSLGDRACLALARISGATAMTTEKIWSRIADVAGVNVHIIR